MRNRLVIFLVLGFSAMAVAATPIVVRSGNHTGFGRIVFDAPANVAYQVTRNGDAVSITFDPGAVLTGTPPLPRNILALHVSGSEAELTVATGTTFHDMRVGDHVVVDVFDPGSPSTPPRSSTTTPPPRSSPTTAPPRASTTIAPPRSPPAPPGGAIGLTRGLPAATPVTRPTPPAIIPLVLIEPAPLQDSAAASSVSVATPSAPVHALQIFGTPPPESADAGGNVGTPTGPIALVAKPEQPAEGHGSTFVVPFSATTGAAAFRRGGDVLVVFDEQRPVDMAALHGDPVFADATADVLPAGTLIRIPLRAGVPLTLARVPEGWSITVGGASATGAGVSPIYAGGRLRLAATNPGRVVAVADPATGTTLLVGTQRQPGQSVVIRRQMPQFALLPTLQGVAIEPFADTIQLRAVVDGFVLSAEPGAVAVSPALSDAPPAAAVLTRRFDFPAVPRDVLIARLHRQLAAAATAPPLGRGPLQRTAAESMIALGMAAEAGGLLQVAMEDDPQEAHSPTTIGLAAIAAMLAGRVADSAGIGDTRLSGSDEVALWRAIRDAMQDKTSPRAATVLAATAPLLLTYPDAMRDRLLPLVLETMAQGGATGAAAALLADCRDEPGLDLARAILDQATGDTKDALARYDAVAVHHDQRDAARAAMRAIALRLASGKINANQAADAIDRRLYAWRGGHRELAWREREAEWRQQAGEWRLALAALRDAKELFPDSAPELQSRLQATFAALLRDKEVDKLPPLELVALVNDNADLLPATPEGEAMQARLADRLLDLDLPQRAGPVLEKLMQSAPTPVGRAGFGARLAALRLREGDASGALATLAASAAPDLPAPLTERRALVFADASARRGDIGAAVAALVTVGSPAADEARARILEQAKDWPAADRAIADYAARSVPNTGDLNDPQRQILLRYATDAARAGDAASLAALREGQAGRMGTGPLADMFRLLTADDVRGMADLQRAGREVGLARALPDDLKSVHPAIQTP